MSPRDQPRSAELNLWREILSVSASKLVTLAGGVTFTILLARYFSVELFGAYVFVYAAVQFLVKLVDGLGKAVRKRVSEAPGPQGEHLVAGALAVGIFAAAVGLVLGPIVVFVDIAAFGGIFELLTPTLLAAAYLLFISESLSKLSINYVAGRGYPGRSEWVGKSLAGGSFLVLTAAILVFELGSAPAVFLAGAASYGLSAVLLLAVVRPQADRLPTRAALASLYEFAKWSVPNDVVNDFYNTFDVVVLGVLVTAASVSYYQVSLQTAGLVYALSHGIFVTTNVTISGKHGQGEAVEPTLRDTLSIAGLLPLAAIVIAVAFGNEILTIVFGSEFSAAYWFFVGLAVQQLLHGYRKCFAGFFYGIDRPSVNFRANVSAVGTNVVTVLPLIAAFGGVGVVLSTLLADVVRSLGFIRHLRRWPEPIGIPRSIPEQFASAAVMFVAALALAATVTVTAVTLPLLVLASLVVYAGVLFSISSQFQTAATAAVTHIRGDRR